MLLISYPENNYARTLSLNYENNKECVFGLVDGSDGGCLNETRLTSKVSAFLLLLLIIHYLKNIFLC